MGSRIERLGQDSDNFIIKKPSRIEKVNNKRSSQNNQALHSFSAQTLPNPFLTTIDHHQNTTSNSIINPPVYLQKGYSGFMDSPSRALQYGRIGDENAFYHEPEVVYEVYDTLFDPRLGSNMSMIEKVDMWIQNIPIRYHRRDCTVDYFPGVTSYSTSSDESDVIDFSEKDTLFEFQARRVTRYATRLYVNEEEPVARFCDLRREPADYELVNYSFELDYQNSFEIFNDQ